MHDNSRSGFPPIISFFSGGGFLDMGFMSAGFEVIWTNEIDPRFAEFYNCGVTAWQRERGLIDDNDEARISNCSSIKSIRAEVIRQEALHGRATDFGIIGGPPCQDFSVNGNMIGFKGDRGSLTDTYLYKILELKPMFFVMENVSGLVRVKRNAKHFFELLEVMTEDYLIDWKVLNSLDFGVPQSRERIFVVGFNRSLFDFSSLDARGGWFPFERYAHSVNAQASYKWPDATVFGGIPQRPAEIPIGLCVESCLIDPESGVPNAAEYFKLHGDENKLNNIMEGETNRPSFKRLHRYKYSPTACYGNNEVHLHPYKNRRLSVREVLRIQGVEDSYVLNTPGLLTKKFKMIGNGVPVPLGEALGKSIKDILRAFPRKKQTVTNEVVSHVEC